MALTASFERSTPLISIYEIFREWLTNADCFGDPEANNRLADVRGGLSQPKGALKRPLVCCQVIYLNDEPRGAGNFNKTFQHYMMRLIFISSESARNLDGVYGVNELSDKLNKYYQDEDKGRTLLCQAGLKKARMTGMIPDEDENYYYGYRQIRFRVEV